MSLVQWQLGGQLRGTTHWGVLWLVVVEGASSIAESPRDQGTSSIANLQQTPAACCLCHLQLPSGGIKIPYDVSKDTQNPGCYIYRARSGNQLPSLSTMQHHGLQEGVIRKVRVAMEGCIMYFQRGQPRLLSCPSAISESACFGAAELRTLDCDLCVCVGGGGQDSFRRGVQEARQLPLISLNVSGMSACCLLQLPAFPHTV